MNITFEGKTPDEVETRVVVTVSPYAVDHATRVLFEQLDKGTRYMPVFPITMDEVVVPGRLVASAVHVASPLRCMVEVEPPPIPLKDYTILLELEKDPDGRWSGKLHIVTPDHAPHVWIDFRDNCFVAP